LYNLLQDLNADTELEAANGERVKASIVFSYALRYFRNHALQELSDQSQTKIVNEDIRWIITVPAIWKEPAKQFMRQAAYEVSSSRRVNFRWAISHGVRGDGNRWSDGLIFAKTCAVPATGT
jgi:hypothetical protein